MFFFTRKPSEIATKVVAFIAPSLVAGSLARSCSLQQQTTSVISAEAPDNLTICCAVESPVNLVNPRIAKTRMNTAQNACPIYPAQLSIMEEEEKTNQSILKQSQQVADSRYFSHNSSRINILQTPPPCKPKTTSHFPAKYPKGRGGYPLDRAPNRIRTFACLSPQSAF